MQSIEEGVGKITEASRALRESIQQRYPGRYYAEEHSLIRQSLLKLKDVTMEDKREAILYQRSQKANAQLSAQAIINLTMLIERHAPLLQEILISLRDYGIVGVATTMLTNLVGSLFLRTDYMRFQEERELIRDNLSYLFLPSLDISQENVELWIFVQTSIENLVVDLDDFIKDNGFMEAMLTKYSSSVDKDIEEYRARREKIRFYIKKDLFEYFKKLSLFQQLNMLEKMIFMDSRNFFLEFYQKATQELFARLQPIRDDILPQLIRAHKNHEYSKITDLLQTNSGLIGRLLIDMGMILQKIPIINWGHASNVKVDDVEQLVSEINDGLAIVRFLHNEITRDRTHLPPNPTGWVAFFQEPLLTILQKQELSIKINLYEHQHLQGMLYYFESFLDAIDPVDAYIQQLRDIQRCCCDFVYYPNELINKDKLGQIISLNTTSADEELDDDFFNKLLGEEVVEDGKRFSSP